MAVFRFKFHTVHRLKIQLEDQAKNKLGLAAARLNAELAALGRIKAAIASALDDFRRVSGGRFNAGAAKGYNCYVSTMKERAREQKKAVDAARAAVDEARSELAAAARRRKMYDKLREKALALHALDERRLEYLAADGNISYRQSAAGGLAD